MAALDEQGVPWKCKFSCTSLEGVLSVVRAGLAISVVAVGDADKGVRIIDDQTILPSLPMTRLSIKYADKEPSLASKALARTMANAIARI